MGSSTRLYRLSPLAASDLEEIWLYTFRQWSLEQANKYCSNIIKAVTGLASGHNIGQRSGVREGYWKYKIGSHIIYFQLSTHHLDVIRILHNHMDVDTHLKEQN